MTDGVYRSKVTLLEGVPFEKELLVLPYRTKVRMTIPAGLPTSDTSVEVCWHLSRIQAFCVGREWSGNRFPGCEVLQHAQRSPN